MTRLVVILCITLVGSSVAGEEMQHMWTLKTDDTEITVAVKGNQPAITRLADTHLKRNWAADGMNVALMTEVWVTDTEFKTDWKFQHGKYDKKSGILTLTFENTQPRMALRSIWRARPGRGPVEHWMEIENISGEPITISHQDSLSLIGLTCDPKTVLWWINRGAFTAKQGGVFNRPFSPRLDIVLTSNPDNGSSPVPWMAVQVGEEFGLYVGWEFSGVGRVEARAGADPTNLDISVGNNPDFRTDIADREIFCVPAAFVGCYSGDLDEGSYSLHRFILEKLRPPMPRGVPDPILAYNPYMEVGRHEAREPDILRTAKEARELGFELYVNDAMWFPGVGDWRWDPKRFPNGIQPMEEYIHEQGMKLGLWCAWTQGGASPHPGALSVRGPVAHPDWFSSDYPPEWQPSYFVGAPACLAHEDFRKWAISKTQWLVSHHKLDYLKHDINVIVTRCSMTTHRHRYGVDASYWHTLGYYEVQRKLGESFPDLILENCNSGGHIKDFGAIKYSHYTVTTDTLSNLEDRQSIYDSTYVLPPLILQAYTFDNVYLVKGDDPDTLLWRSAMMSAWQMAPAHSSKWSARERESLKESVRLYKEWIRPMLKDVKVHHILRRPDGINWDGMFYWSPGLKRGTLYIFRPESPEHTKIIKLKGLDPGRRYWVWGEDGSIAAGVRSGDELMKAGLSIRLDKQYASDIIMLQDETFGKPKGLVKPGEFHLKTATAGSDPFSVTAHFSWEPSAHARKYRVTISDMEDFSSTVVVLLVSGESATILNLPPGKELYWRVEAVSRGGVCWNSGEPAVLKTPPLKKLTGVVFASDMDWVSSTAGAGNVVHRDENYLANPITIAGKAYKKGLWTHSSDGPTHADVVINVEGKHFSVFRADVGLDDVSGEGSIQFQVIADGEVKAESPIMRPRTVHHLDANIQGAKQVILRVLHGGDGISCDHSDWGFARFIEKDVEDPFQ